jgi:hypothetical protein
MNPQQRTSYQENVNSEPLSDQVGGDSPASALDLGRS